MENIKMNKQTKGSQSKMKNVSLNVRAMETRSKLAEIKRLGPIGNKVYTTEQAAAWFSCRQEVFRHAARAGQLKYRKVGKCYKFLGSELIKWAKGVDCES